MNRTLIPTQPPCPQLSLWLNPASPIPIPIPTKCIPLPMYVSERLGGRGIKSPRKVRGRMDGGAAAMTLRSDIMSHAFEYGDAALYPRHRRHGVRQVAHAHLMTAAVHNHKQRASENLQYYKTALNRERHNSVVGHSLATRVINFRALERAPSGRAEGEKKASPNLTLDCCAAVWDLAPLLAVSFFACFAHSLFHSKHFHVGGTSRAGR